MGIVCRQLLLLLLVLLLLAAGERAAAGRSRRERTLPALRTNTDGGDGDGDESAVGLLDPGPQAQGCVISATTTIVTVVLVETPILPRQAEDGQHILSRSTTDQKRVFASLRLACSP
jgi:hypothetical protein